MKLLNFFILRPRKVVMLNEVWIYSRKFTYYENMEIDGSIFEVFCGIYALYLEFEQFCVINSDKI